MGDVVLYPAKTGSIFFSFFPSQKAAVPDDVTASCDYTARATAGKAEPIFSLFKFPTTEALFFFYILNRTCENKIPFNLNMKHILATTRHHGRLTATSSWRMFCRLAKKEVKIKSTNKK